MTPNTDPNLVALYTHDDPKPHNTSKKIAGWDEDNTPLVISDDKPYRLVRADRYRNYVGIGENPHPQIVALIPAGGWRVEFTWEEATESLPLAGWGLLADGTVVPLATDEDGDVDRADRYHQAFGVNPRIYHPDTETTPAIPTVDAIPLGLSAGGVS